MGPGTLQMLKAKYKSKHFCLVKDWVLLTRRTVSFGDTTVIHFCSYMGQVVNVPNTKLKRNGNQNCPLASAPENPPWGLIIPQLLLYLGTSCIYPQNYSMGWGSAANLAVVAAQWGQMAAQCHTSNSTSGFALPWLRLMLLCSRLCPLTPRVLQKAYCLVYIVVLLHGRKSDYHIQTWPGNLYCCKKIMTWSFYGTTPMRETNKIGAGIDYYDRLKRKMLFGKHCRKPKVVTGE